MSTAAFRTGLAALFLLPWVIAEARKTSQPWWPTVATGACAGLALGIDFSSWNVAIVEAGAGLATVLLNVQVVLLPLMVWALDGHRVSRRWAVVTPLVLVGVALTGGLFAGAGAPSLRGVALGLVAGAGYAAYLYAIRRGAPHTQGRTVSVLVVACATACAVSVSTAAAAGSWEWPGTPRQWLLVLFLALVGQVVAFFCMNAGTVMLPPEVGSTLLLLPSVLALGLSALLLGERLTLSQGLGCLIVLAGAWWMTRPRDGGRRRWRRRAGAAAHGLHPRG